MYEQVSYARMANITKSDIDHVAKLSSLNLTDSEKAHFAPQLSSIISHIESLSEVDTQGVLPTSQTTGLENVMREDVIDPIGVLSVDSVVSQANAVHNNYFVVDMLLKERSDS
jgi:aspartyl-tRNA(Asn)/glutamyl-tRNA(Gln) amidotransferase subunit C